MPYYEVVFETGNSSVAFYNDEAEALGACQAQNDRAVAGSPGGPTGAPAERVVRLLEYDSHPDDYDPTTDMTEAEMNTLISGAVGTFSGDAEMVAAFTRGLRSPTVQKENPHDSQFAKKEIKDVKLGWVV